MRGRYPSTEWGVGCSGIACVDGQIRNPEKLKKMNKKQLRQVKRTRVNEHGVVEFVGAYS